MTWVARLRRIHTEESGSVLVLVAIVLVALLLSVGLVIDIGGVRAFRADQQIISDAAASAGAVVLAETGSGRDACEAAKAYVVANSTSISSLAGVDCSTVPVSCDAGTAETVLTSVEDRFTISVTYPVRDTSPLIDSSVIGAISQPASLQDGDACDRLGVTINSEWSTTFARLAGIDSLSANVHTVALGTLSVDEAVPLNLLLLDRSGCQALHTAGNGGVIVEAVYNPDQDGDPSNGLQPVLQPGVAAVDSDGSDGCGGTDGVIDLDGSNSVIRADGPTGCVNESGTHVVSGLTAGEGCGRIRVLAPGTPGCNAPACTAGGGNLPNPDPIALRSRMTRASVDHRYNCKPDYSTIPPSIAWATSALTVSNEQDIPGCPDTPAPNIDQLIEFVGQAGTPSGFQTWTLAGFPCTIDGPPGFTMVVPAGNWHVDCPLFSVKRGVTFQDGNIVFDGSVEVESSGTLAVNADAGSLKPAGAETWVFLRDGHFRKAGDATIVMNNTFVYASSTSYVEMAGGDGGLTWIAPDQGSFDDLALWGDSPSTHLWAGQAGLQLEGVFFTPFALAEYSGTAGQNQVRAQFIAWALYARGQGTLVVAPGLGRSVEFRTAESVLIR